MFFRHETVPRAEDKVLKRPFVDVQLVWFNYLWVTKGCLEFPTEVVSHPG